MTRSLASSSVVLPRAVRWTGLVAALALAASAAQAGLLGGGGGGMVGGGFGTGGLQGQLQAASHGSLDARRPALIDNTADKAGTAAQRAQDSAQTQADQAQGRARQAAGHARDAATSAGSADATGQAGASGSLNSGTHAAQVSGSAQGGDRTPGATPQAAVSGQAGLSVR
jgi:hypothetical protein